VRGGHNGGLFLTSAGPPGGQKSKMRMVCRQDRSSWTGFRVESARALRDGVLNLPPVIRLVLVVEVSDSRDVRRMAVNPGPMSCRLLGSE
jgi:hypothetical protein